jgi:hypothetical protein
VGHRRPQNSSTYILFKSMFLSFKAHNFFKLFPFYPIYILDGLNYLVMNDPRPTSAHISFLGMNSLFAAYNFINFWCHHQFLSNLFIFAISHNIWLYHTIYSFLIARLLRVFTIDPWYFFQFNKYYSLFATSCTSGKWVISIILFKSYEEWK